VDCAPTSVRWFVVDASAITDIDYSAAQSVRDFIDELKRRGVQIVFARATPTFDQTWIGITLRTLLTKSGFLQHFTKP
jgi:anti-anti-sigma regulatory factor